MSDKKNEDVLQVQHFNGVSKKNDFDKYIWTSLSWIWNNNSSSARRMKMKILRRKHFCTWNIPSFTDCKVVEETWENQSTLIEFLCYFWSINTQKLINFSRSITCKCKELILGGIQRRVVKGYVDLVLDVALLQVLVDDLLVEHCERRHVRDTALWDGPWNRKCLM